MPQRFPKYSLFILLFFTGRNLWANTIFPAFATPYVSVLLLPAALISVLLVEILVYKRHNTNLHFLIIVGLVVLVNLASWFAGIMLSDFFPHGLVTGANGLLTVGPDFSKYARYGFAVAYILSVIIEYTLLKLAALKLTVERPLKTVVWANTASYLTLTAILMVVRYV